MSVHIAIIPSRQGNKTYYSKLLRRSYRDARARAEEDPGQPLEPLRRGHRTAPGAPQGQALPGSRGCLRGTSFPLPRRREAVSIAFQRLGLPALLADRPSRERNLACAMIAARIIRPHTKLATTRWWQDTTLETEFDIEGAHVDDSTRRWIGSWPARTGSRRGLPLTHK